jgi:hypothetical protein
MASSILSTNKSQVVFSSTMQWSCTVCTLKNHVALLKCDACETERHSIPEVEAVFVVVS